MDAAHLHLVLNHFPVIGTVITMFLLFLGILLKSGDIRKAALLVLILTSVVTIPVYVSGDGAQQIVEGNFDDVDEEYIDEHEDFALYSFVAMNIAGFVAILALFFFRKSKEIPVTFAIPMFVLVLIVNGMMAYTANLGGKIHHPEIRGNTQTTGNTGADNDSKQEGQKNSGTESVNKEKSDAKDKDDDKDE